MQNQYSMDEIEYYDDLGGAYYFADDKDSFEGRTPDNSGCGCLAGVILIVFISAFHLLCTAL
ncbi:MAG: hypothetical protein AB1546_03525 [bacterium]